MSDIRVDSRVPPPPNLRFRSAPIPDAKLPCLLYLPVSSVLFSIVVGISTWALVIDEVVSIQGRVNVSERKRSLPEIETVGEIVGRGVSIAQRRQGESPFNEFEDAAEIVRDMR